MRRNRYVTHKGTIRRLRRELREGRISPFGAKLLARYQHRGVDKPAEVR